MHDLYKWKDVEYDLHELKKFFKNFEINPTYLSDDINIREFFNLRRNMWEMIS